MTKEGWAGFWMAGRLFLFMLLIAPFMLWGVINGVGAFLFLIFTLKGEDVSEWSQWGMHPVLLSSIRSAIGIATMFTLAAIADLLRIRYPRLLP